MSSSPEIGIHVSILFIAALKAESSTYLIGIPGALDVRVELEDELGQALSTGLAQAVLIQEEVDSQVGLADLGLVVYGETTDS